MKKMCINKYDKAACVYLMMMILVISTAAIGMNSTKACMDGGSINIDIALSLGFYLNTCPEAESIVFSWVRNAVSDDPRMAASLLRLHFHDCFVNGCDASVLLDDTEDLVGEKTAAPNVNSLRGFEVIDAIKADLEYVCPQTVSCADILAIAARDSVLLSGGPGWEVEMGRKDSLTASKTAANNNIPSPNSDLPTLISKFQDVGLSLQDLVALSGAHTMGKARCSTFRGRLSSGGDDMKLEFLEALQQLCLDQANTTLADLDHMTPMSFDNQYYVNLVAGEGLLGSDQLLLTGMEETRGIVGSYANDIHLFFQGFERAMINMGRVLAKTNNGQGEIRTNCRLLN